MKNALRRKETSESLARSIHPTLLTEHQSLPVLWRAFTRAAPELDLEVSLKPHPKILLRALHLLLAKPSLLQGFPHGRMLLPAFLQGTPSQVGMATDQDSNSWVLWHDTLCLCLGQAWEKKAGPWGSGESWFVKSSGLNPCCGISHFCVGSSHGRTLLLTFRQKSTILGRPEMIRSGKLRYRWLNSLVLTHTGSLGQGTTTSLTLGQAWWDLLSNLDYLKGTENF